MERSSYLRREKWKVSVKLKRYRLALNSQKGADNVANSGGVGGMFMLPKFGVTKRLPRGRPPKRPFQGVCVCVHACVCVCGIYIVVYIDACDSVCSHLLYKLLSFLKLCGSHHVLRTYYSTSPKVVFHS